MIQTIRAGGIEDLTVILGYEFERIREVIHDKSVRILKNDLWEQGISSSVRVGLEKIDPKANDVVIFVVDQPFLSPELITLFISHYMTHRPGSWKLGGMVVIRFCSSGDIFQLIDYGCWWFFMSR